MNSENPVQPRFLLHYAALVIASIAASILFIREPGFGDELGYWNLAFDLHDIGGHAWGEKSFHDLRWPIWGVNWLWIGLFGPGLASFYCEPAFYMAAASMLAFTFGWLTLRSLPAAWACAITLWFAPVLDAVVWRPMPDLSESFFGGCAVLAWWAMMQARDRRRIILFGALAGIAIGLAFSNRVAGVFIAPVLAVATLILYPRRWFMVLIPAVFSMLYVGLEATVYHAVCGDWLHAIHANANGRGAKDAEPIALLRLPFRYLSGFFKANRLAPVYAILAAAGLWSGWTRRGKPGQLIVIWFAVLFLEYSCMIQSLHPVRPLFGSTFRYLAGFCIPMSLLVVMGCAEILPLLGRYLPRLQPLGRRLAGMPLLVGVASVVFLALFTKRPLFNPGYTRPFRAHLAALPDHAKIFTHHQMRDLAFMVDPHDANRLQWNAPPKILKQDPTLEREALLCDELWYLRKHLWLTERKSVERELPKLQPPLAAYIDHPQQDWILNDVLLQGDAPELAFYRRRPSNAAPAHLLEPGSAEFKGLLPPLPAHWDSSLSKRFEFKWPVPVSLRGKLLTFQFQGSSPTVEPIQLKLRFMNGRKRIMDCDFKPILYANGGKEFVALPIPAEAQDCEVAFILTKAKSVDVSEYHAVYDDLR